MYNSDGFKIGLICLVAFLALCTAERTYSGYVDKGQYLVNVTDKAVKEEYCPGALISPMHVLTTAYCILQIDKGNLVVAGGIAAKSSAAVVKRGVAKVFIPRDYRRADMNMDIAVIKLTHEMSGSEIKPIELTPEDPQQPHNYVNVVGLNAMNELHISEVFHVMPFVHCARELAEFSVTLPKATTCFFGSDWYSSRPGTAVTVTVHGLKLAGVVSWTNVQEHGHRTVGFTKIPAVRDFIDAVMRLP